MEQRSVLRFENAVKSKATFKAYSFSLNRFVLWAKLKDWDSLLQLKDSFLQELCEDYLFYLKKTVSPNSIGSYFAAIDLFLTINDKLINMKKIRKMFPSKVKKTGKQAYTTEQIQTILKFKKTPRMVALIHFLCSTGCRIGAIPDIKMRHKVDMELGCTAILFYEGTEQEYWGFLTPEATKALNVYLTKRLNDGEIFGPQTPLFRKTYAIGASKAQPIKLESLMSQVSNAIKVIERVKSEVNSKRYNIQRDHGFRKWFNEKIKLHPQVDLSLAEKLMDHAGVFKLDGSYLNPPREVLFDEFKKHISNLTIDENDRTKSLVNTLKIEKDMAIKESENMKHQFSKRIRDNERKMDQMKKQIDELLRSKK